MPLTKSKGNMYPWVTHTHSHLGGECSHACGYCYVQAMEKRFKSGRYAGPLRLISEEFKVKYGYGRTIFIEHCNDLFAYEVPREMIMSILNHCRAYPGNTYVFQTKNPRKMAEYIRHMPEEVIIGTTIESNIRYGAMGDAPSPEERATCMHVIACAYPDSIKRFVTIEPVMDFDVEPFADMIVKCSPFFVNLGADSKNSQLPEPSIEKIKALVAALHDHGIELIEKHNLERLRK